MSRGRSRLGAPALALALALAPWAAAAAPLADAEGTRALVAPYLEARARGVVGAVAGEVAAEPRTPAGRPDAVVGARVMLLPRSEALGAELDAVKRSARDSASSYVAAEEKLRVLRAAYEGALAEAGAADLVRSAVSDAEGRFRFADVPAGRWLLLAWYEVPHTVSGRKVSGKAATKFRDNQERTGYSAVTYWRMDLDVRAAEGTPVSLHDRNGWITAVRESLRAPSGTGTGGRR